MNELADFEISALRQDAEFALVRVARPNGLPSCLLLRVDVLVRQKDITSADLPKSVLQYVIRTREQVIIDDAAVSNPYSGDAYLADRKARSVLCLPIVKQATTDIDDQKRAAEALREAQAELAHVARVTTMREITASIAHEVRQPIAGILVNGNSCLRWLDRVKDESGNLAQVRTALQRIIRDGNRAGEIIARSQALFRKTETTSCWARAAFHTTKPGGLGMGLSIRRSIVENHSGRLWVTEHDGPGASFHFSLPSHLAEGGVDVLP